jgi:hypothetical protein
MNIALEVLMPFLKELAKRSKERMIAVTNNLVREVNVEIEKMYDWGMESENAFHLETKFGPTRQRTDPPCWA